MGDLALMPGDRGPRLGAWLHCLDGRTAWSATRLEPTIGPAVALVLSG